MNDYPYGHLCSTKLKKMKYKYFVAENPNLIQGMRYCGDSHFIRPPIVNMELFQKLTVKGKKAFIKDFWLSGWEVSAGFEVYQNLQKALTKPREVLANLQEDFSLKLWQAALECRDLTALVNVKAAKWQEGSGTLALKLIVHPHFSPEIKSGSLSLPELDYAALLPLTIICKKGLIGAEMHPAWQALWDIPELGLQIISYLAGSNTKAIELVMQALSWESLTSNAAQGLPDSLLSETYNLAEFPLPEQQVINFLKRFVAAFAEAQQLSSKEDGDILSLDLSEAGQAITTVLLGKEEEEVEDEILE